MGPLSPSGAGFQPARSQDGCATREGQGEGVCGRVSGTAGARAITRYPDLPPLPDGQAILQLVSQRDVIASDARRFFSASSVLAPYQVSR